MAAVARASFALPPVRLEAKIWRIMFCTWRLAHPALLIRLTHRHTSLADQCKILIKVASAPWARGLMLNNL